MPLKDLIAHLGHRRASGLLRLLKDDVQKQVQLRDGQVVGATSNQVREYLGQFLVNMGLLTEDQFDKAYATQRETNVPLGKILVMIGLVTEEDVERALALKFRETLLEAFTWSEGEFTYDMTVEPQEGNEISVSVALQDILQEGQQREAAWQAVRALFPSGKLRLEVDEQRLPEGLKPESLDGRLLQLIREGRTLEELVQSILAPEYLVYHRLYALHRQELVQVPAMEQAEAQAEEDEVLVGEVVEGEPSVEELIQTAQSLLAEGNLRGGETLARQAHALARSPETEELLRSAEAALLGSLRRQLLYTPQVPLLLVRAAHLRTLKLSAPQLYLLSRIDGKRDLGSIINSPLQSLNELEVLKYFQDCMEQGLVQLAPLGSSS